MEIIVSFILRELGILPTYVGYKYLIDAIVLGYTEEGSLEHITKDIYPELAQRHNASSWMIETDIRNTIQRSWKNINLDKAAKYFPELDLKRRPTNTIFIEAIVTHIRRHNEKNWEI